MIVSYGVAEGVLRALASAAPAGDRPVAAASLDALLSDVRAGRATVALIGADGPGAVADARRVQLTRRETPVVLVTGAGCHGEVEAALRVDPLVGRATRCVPAEDPTRLAAVVADAADAERRRQSHRAVAARVAVAATPFGQGSEGAPAQYLGQLLEHVAMGVVTIDPDGTIKGWNARAEEITGRRQRDAVGSSVYALFREDDATRLRLEIERLVRGGQSTTQLVSRLGPSGSEQWLEVTAANIGGGAGSIGALIMLQDITDVMRVEHELDVHMRHSALAADVGLALTRTSTLSVQLQRCAEAVVRHLDAAFARIWTLDAPSSTLVLRASAGRYTHLDGPHSRVRVGELKIGRIASSRRPHLTNDVVTDPHISDPEWARREGMTAFAGYPLVVGDRLVGVLALFSRHPLADSTIGALASVADTVAVGIQQAANAESVALLLERETHARAEMERALERNGALLRTLQQSLLPPTLSAPPGVDVAARYHWAGTGDVVGGDFYDSFRLADGRHCVVIGDVSGKGVEAASLTALARHTLRAAARSAATPPEVLEALNEIILEQAGGERFCTVAIVATEHRDDRWEVTLTNAGHVPAVHLTAGGMREVALPGLPVGVFDRLGVVEHPLDVAAGDAVVLVTDGVTEARTPDGRFRPDLLRDVLLRTRGSTAHRITEEVERAVVAIQDGRPRDDVAVVALRFLTADVVRPGSSG